MAGILLAVNGLDNALEFIYGLRDRGLTGDPLDNLTMRPRTDAETGGRDVD